MDEKLFKNGKLIYENSEDITLMITFVDEGGKEPRMIYEISAQKLKDLIGTRAFFDGPASFDVMIHAIKDNDVYVTVFERIYEDNWRAYRQFVLNKHFPTKMDKLVYSGKPCGFFIVSVKEWGKIKRGIML